MTLLHARLFNAAILSIVFLCTIPAFAQMPMQVLPRGKPVPPANLPGVEYKI